MPKPTNIRHPLPCAAESRHRSVTLWRLAAVLLLIAGPLAAWGHALNGAIWTWVGFFLPLQIGRVAWEQRKWGLVILNSSVALVRLIMFGMIMAYWR